MSMSDDIRLQTDGIQRSWTDCLLVYGTLVYYRVCFFIVVVALCSRFFFLVDVILIPEYTDVHAMRLQTRQHRNSSSRFSHILLSIMRKNSFLSIHISIVHIQAVCVYERVSFGINKKEDTNACSHIQLQQCNVPAYFPSDVYLVSRIVSIVQSSQYH